MLGALTNGESDAGGGCAVGGAGPPPTRCSEATLESLEPLESLESLTGQLGKLVHTGPSQGP
jgi:hypothetical protein